EAKRFYFETHRTSFNLGLLVLGRRAPHCAAPTSGANTPGATEDRASWNRAVSAVGCASNVCGGCSDLRLLCVSTGLPDGEPLLPDGCCTAVPHGKFPFVGYRFCRFFPLSGLLLRSADFFPANYRRVGHTGADLLLNCGA